MPRYFGTQRGNRKRFPYEPRRHRRQTTVTRLSPIICEPSWKLSGLT